MWLWKLLFYYVVWVFFLLNGGSGTCSCLVFGDNFQIQIGWIASLNLFARKTLGMGNKSKWIILNDSVISICTVFPIKWTGSVWRILLKCAARTKFECDGIWKWFGLDNIQLNWSAPTNGLSCFKNNEFYNCFIKKYVHRLQSRHQTSHKIIFQYYYIFCSIFCYENAFEGNHSAI